MVVVISDLFTMSDSFKATQQDESGISSKNQAIELLQRRKNDITSRIKKLYNLYASSGNDLLLETIQENQRELDEKHMENMRNMDSKGNERDVVCVYVEPKINPREFTFFINRSNQHTYSYTY